jgi:hypothetical protein
MIFDDHDSGCECGGFACEDDASLLWRHDLGLHWSRLMFLIRPFLVCQARGARSCTSRGAVSSSWRSGGRS